MTCNMALLLSYAYIKYACYLFELMINDVVGINKSIENSIQEFSTTKLNAKNKELEYDRTGKRKERINILVDLRYFSKQEMYFTKN